MLHDFLDRHSRLESPIHRLPAHLKMAAALACVIGTILIPAAHAWGFAAVAAALCLITAISRIPPAFLIRRLLLLEPFVLGVAVLALFGPGGWRMFLLLAVRCTICLLAMLLLANTTPFSEILRVLRRGRVPSLLVTTLALMYRYLFVFIEEAERMRTARLSRTFTPTRARQWHLLATVAGQLFVRASERAEHIYAAMCARGWR